MGQRDEKSARAFPGFASETPAALNSALNYQPFRIRTYYHLLLYVCRNGKASELEEQRRLARRSALLLRNFTNFLLLHSWGNCKSMTSLFDGFLHPTVNTRQKRNFLDLATRYPFVLRFGAVDQQRIILGCDIYTLFHHRVSRQLRLAGDKLAVSSLSGLHYILKFHRQAFSRRHLERMAEVLSIHSSPELNSMIDTLLSSVVSPYLRRIRNGLYRYRFFTAFEQEIRYINRVSDLESAAFNFSLDATDNVKSHYLKLLEKAYKDFGHKCYENTGSGVYDVAVLNGILGDLYEIEQSYDQANICYGAAISALKPRVESPFEDFDPESLVLYCRYLLKQGDMEEHRQNLEIAAAIYQHAMLVMENLPLQHRRTVGEALRREDSKWDVLKQAFWARCYLNLKRSSNPWRKRYLLPPRILYPKPEESAVFLFNKGKLTLFCNDHKASSRSLWSAYRLCGAEKLGVRERTSFLAGSAAVWLGHNLIVGFMKNLLKTMLADSGVRRSKDIDPLVAKKAQDSYWESLNGLCRDMERVEGLGAFLRDVEDEGGCLREVEKKRDSVRKETPARKKESIGGYCDSSADGTAIVQLKLREILGLILHGANEFTKAGMQKHASMAYLSMLSIWAMVLDMYRLDRYFNDSTKTPDFVNQSRTWIVELRQRALTDISSSHGRANSGFVERFASYDTAPLYTEIRRKALGRENRGKIEKHYKDLPASLREAKALPTGVSNPLTLFADEHGEILEPPETFHEAAFWQHTLLGQLLTMITLWEYRNHYFFTPENAGVANIDQRCVLPYPVRGFIISHWLSGRYFLQEMKSNVKKIKASVENQLNNKASSFPPSPRYCLARISAKKRNEEENETEEKELEKLLLVGARSLENIYLASHNHRLISGNEQDLVFPPPFLMFFDHWMVLYELMSVVVPAANLSIPESARWLRDQLTPLVSREIPSAHLDYSDVKQRALTCLRETENLGDTNSMPRVELIKRRYYLNDDFSSPQFLLDWTLVQMSGPYALMCRLSIQLQDEKLAELARKLEKGVTN